MTTTGSAFAFGFAWVSLRLTKQDLSWLMLHPGSTLVTVPRFNFSDSKYENMLYLGAYPIMTGLVIISIVRIIIWFVA
jgi:hypothetical protein